MTRPVFTPPTDGTEPDDAAFVAELQRVVDALYDHTEDRVAAHDHAKAQIAGLKPALRRAAASARTRPGAAPWAWTTQAAGAPDDVPGLDEDGAIGLQNVPGLGDCAVVTNADRLIAPRDAVAVHPGRVYVAFFAARRLVDPVDISGAGMRFALERLGADYATQGSTVLEDRTLWAADGIWRGAFTFALGAPALGSVDAQLSTGTVHVRPFVRCYGLDSVEAVAQVQVLDVTEAALVDGAMDARALEQALADAKAAATKAAAAESLSQANAAALDATNAQIQTAIGAAIMDLNLDSFGAVGDGVTDDRGAILSAIAAAHAAGGGRVRATAGKEYAFTGRIAVPQFVHLDLGQEPQGARLLALSDQGGVDMLAGCQVTGWLRASGKNDEIGLLGLRRETMVERPREGEAQVRYDVFLDRAGAGSDRFSEGSIGLHWDNPDYDQATRDSLGIGNWNGINWTRGKITIRYFDYAVKVFADGDSGFNSNTLTGDIRNFVHGVFWQTERVCALNRLDLQFQTGGGQRAKRAIWLKGGFTRTHIAADVWDWNETSVDPNDNAVIQLGPEGGVRQITWSGNVGDALNGETVFVDQGSSTRPGNTTQMTGTRVPPMQRPILPAQRQFIGDLDNHLASAHRSSRGFSVSQSGTDSFTGGSLGRIFSPGIAEGLIENGTQAIIEIDAGTDPQWSTLGVDFGRGNRDLDRAKIEISPNGTDWTVVASGGYGGNPGVPNILGYFDSQAFTTSGDRYARFTFERDTPGEIRVARIFGTAENGSVSGRGGYYARIEEADFIRSVNVLPRGNNLTDNDGYLLGGAMALNRQGLHVNGQQVVAERQGAIASPSADVAALKTAVDALRAALAAHGLIES